MAGLTGPAAGSTTATNTPAITDPTVRSPGKDIVYVEMSGLRGVGSDEVAEAIAVGFGDVRHGDVGRGVLDARRTPLDSLIAALSAAPGWF